MGIAYEGVEWVYIDNFYVDIIVSKCTQNSLPFHGRTKFLRRMKDSLYRFYRDSKGAPFGEQKNILLYVRL